MKVVLASKNPHKLVEISAILQPLQVELVLESELGVDIEVEETGQTFEENSFCRSMYSSDRSHKGEIFRPTTVTTAHTRGTTHKITVANTASTR